MQSTRFIDTAVEVGADADDAPRDQLRLLASMILWPSIGRALAAPRISKSVDPSKAAKKVGNRGRLLLDQAPADAGASSSNQADLVGDGLATGCCPSAGRQARWRFQVRREMPSALQGCVAERLPDRYSARERTPLAARFLRARSRSLSRLRALYRPARSRLPTSYEPIVDIRSSILWSKDSRSRRAHSSASSIRPLLPARLAAWSRSIAETSGAQASHQTFRRSSTSWRSGRRPVFFQSMRTKQQATW
jgi:hypothetical protein